MIKKLRHSFRHLSLYWKNLIITTITLVLTLIIFFLLFSLFATKFLENNQRNKFNKAVNEITTIIEKNGIDEEKLNQFMIEGYTIFISSGDQLIYPSYSTSMALTIVDSAEGSENISGVTAINTFDNGNASLSKRNQIFYQNYILSVEVYYPVAVNPNDVKTILVGIIPYFILTGFLVALGISRIYSRYFTSKISELNDLVHQMSTSSISSEYHSKTGDELQELKNNVYFMYQELQETLTQLNQEMERVKRLETDRQVFMRGATHELKTPIMAVMTTLSGMIEGIEGYENQEVHLTKCYSRLQSMSRLVNEMLEISRLETVVFSGVTDINQTTQDVLDMYDYMIADKQLEVYKQLGNSLNLKIPERNLQKIVSNLIGNSVKYSPENTQILIESNESMWEIRNKVKESHSIKIDTIFDPFVSNDTDEDSAETSHGLGLYVVSGMLKQYGYPFECYLDEQTQEFVFRLIIKK